MKRRTITMTDALWSVLQMNAEAKGCSVSALISDAMQAFLFPVMYPHVPDPRHRHEWDLEIAGSSRRVCKCGTMAPMAKAQ